MIPVLLLLIPLITGLTAFFIKHENGARSWALFSSIATLVVTLLGITVFNKYQYLSSDCAWLPMLGSRFTLVLDGMGKLLALLTAIAFPLIFVSTWKSRYKDANQFFGLMLLSQAGLLLVFMAMDALLFYFGWEIALIPAYFLCSKWGGEKRIQATFKFFVYTFAGSLLMLIGLIYLYFQTPDQTFAINAFYELKLSVKEQSWLFWLFFVAFAIKMPIFPFHTWQPDTYEQSPTAVTMVLSGVMVKMGVFALIRWLLPVLPYGTYMWGDTATSMAVIGMIYASLIAIKQDDIKRLVAYSSIAHIGLMCVAIFAYTEVGMKGAILQMFNHGINIIGLWIVVELIERQYGTRKMSELGGLAQNSPVLAIFLVVLAFANIALPLTNAFVGEFLMFNGIFSSTITKYNVVFTVVAGLSIILAAIYTLNMVQKVFYGNTNTLTSTGYTLGGNEKLALGVLVIVILYFGVYPQPLFDLSQDTVTNIMERIKINL
ncbi:NuoM family protein [Parasegetibacter sp. NRK P23]|uniref:complex I subunit 4 family protein n=1 Tax=Parasegetibacter sp. NRK P23 TaxID=2942999 RepID=UPI00204334CF|nr:NADH-quinone oxidoreductase subunit M [Parasegetibacter sp. NRK P23]MCM5527380.1 NADH-quinone oxidoreductase subunit M [Parasegetibacter sp. NRK P23]